MKFTTKIVVILFIILLSLGIFLYFLNDLTKKQEREEKDQEYRKQQIKKEKIHNKIQKKVETNAVLESFMNKTDTIPFNELDTEYGKQSKENDQEKNTDLDSCPDILIHRGDVIVLYNSRSQTDKVVATFHNLDEYADYVKEKQASGTYCPVLFLRKENDLQGRDVYRLYPLFHPNQVPLYDDSMELKPKEKKHDEWRPVPSVHYPIEDGDMWSNGWMKRPAMKMPPPFLKTVSGWDLHHMPPLYIEGGLPPTPIEDKSKGGTDGTDPTAPVPIPFPIDDIAVAPPPNPMTKETPRFQNFDPYEMYKQSVFSNSDLKPTTVPPGKFSENAYDPNWGGVLYSVASVESGKYDNNVVKPATYPDLGYV